MRSDRVRRRARVVGLALLVAISGAYVTAYFLDRAGADFEQTGDTPHLDYGGYANWAVAVGGGTVEERMIEAEQILDKYVPDCRQLEQNIHRAGNLVAAEALTDPEPGEESAPPIGTIVLAAFYKCGREALVEAINSGRDLRDFGVTENSINSLAKYNSTGLTGEAHSGRRAPALLSTRLFRGGRDWHERKIHL